MPHWLLWLLVSVNTPATLLLLLVPSAALLLWFLKQQAAVTGASQLIICDIHFEGPYWGVNLAAAF